LRQIGLLGLLLIAGGCTSMTPGRMENVRVDSDRPRAGNVYLLRGWIGIFSYGINELGEKLNKSGVRACVYQDDQWSALAEAIKQKYRSAKGAEPLVLIGHSFGADDVLRVSRELGQAGVAVDLVVTLDPVTPPDVPANVRRCYNIYQSNGAWDNVPAFRGVPLKAAEGTELANVDIRKDRTDLLEPGTDHFNIEKKSKVHQEVLKQVLATCPPREQWARGRAVPAPPHGVTIVKGNEPPARNSGTPPTTQQAVTTPAGRGAAGAN
jgi:hypothetical protein